MARRADICLGIIAGIGILLVAGGIALMFVIPSLLQSQIEQKIPLVEGSDIYKKWLNPPVPIYMSFYFFDVQNAEEIVKYGAKPRVKERGPYAYREIRVKENITFYDNGTLSYIQRKYYHFDRAKSVGPETDTLTTLNIPILGLSTLVRFKSSFLQSAISMAVSGAGEDVLFQKYTVKDLLWGYPIAGLHAINKVTNLLFDATYLDAKFGLMYQNKMMEGTGVGNGSHDGVYTIYTGAGDTTKFNLIDRWNGVRYMSNWKTKHANMINGTDGTMFHPFVKKDETLYIFSTELCRSAFALFKEETTVNLIPAYKYAIPPYLFDNVTKNPDNIGFCTPDCLPSGVLNISSCKLGAPVLVSFPHFLLGDQKLIDAIDGINPNRELHESYASVEPLSGLPLDGDKKLQMNAYVRKTEILTGSEHLDGMVFPLLWMQQSASLDAAATQMFKQEILFFVKLADLVPWIAVDVGSVILFCCFLLAAGKFW